MLTPRDDDRRRSGTARCACAANAQAIPGAQAESSAALAKGEWPAYPGIYAGRAIRSWRNLIAPTPGTCTLPGAGSHRIRHRADVLLSGEGFRSQGKVVVLLDGSVGLSLTNSESPFGCGNCALSATSVTGHRKSTKYEG